MEPLEKLELFSRTFENTFIFNLFDVILCGIIVLAILKAWRGQTKPVPVRNQLLLLVRAIAVSARVAHRSRCQIDDVPRCGKPGSDSLHLCSHLSKPASWPALCRGRAGLSFCGCIASLYLVVEFGK